MYIAHSLIAGKLDSHNLFSQLYMFLNQPLQGNKTARELDFWSCGGGFLRLLDFWKLSDGMHYYDLGGDLAEYPMESTDTELNVELKTPNEMLIATKSLSYLIHGCELHWEAVH